MTSPVDIGAKAPEFSLPRDGGSELSLRDLEGKPVVLYFYPKDDTPGCTKEAIDFTAHKAEFDQLGAVIVGVSPDTPAKHDKFKAKHDLAITLVSDEDKTLCEAYGVWVEKNMYGRKYMGVERSTFLIAPDGKVAKVWRKVKVKNHAADVLGAVEEL